MKKWMVVLAAVAAVTPVMLWAQSDEEDAPKSSSSNAFEKNLIKNRAAKYKETGGKSASGDLYIYVDDKQVKKQLEDIRNTPARERSRSIDIASPVIKKEDKIRSVTAVVDLKKDLTIDAGSKTTVNVANPHVEDGAKPKKINSIIDAEDVKVK
jgi:DNA primase catalytic subunit